MPLYYKLRYLPRYAVGRSAMIDAAERSRIVDNILALRRQLAAEIPKRTVRESLLLATWNIRDFGGKRLNPSPRLSESLFYMAEVISAFDLVAVQEVNENMAEFTKFMEILGYPYRFIATDVTEGSSGNSERMVFVYDSSKVSFQNIAGEIVLGKKNQVNDSDQFARTPFLVKFQIGWLKFNLCTVHLFYGDTSGEGYARRVKEIEKIGEVLKGRAERDLENYILLGDMNIIDLDDKTFTALKKNGFIVPSELAKSELPGSNNNQDKFYDQIALLNNKGEMELGTSENNAGIFNYYRSVFKESDFATYQPLATNTNSLGNDEAARKKYFRGEWRTWQMSDHLPMWVEMKIDFTDKYLKKLKEVVPPIPTP